jgi:hypothetical protein
MWGFFLSIPNGTEWIWFWFMNFGMHQVLHANQNLSRDGAVIPL